MKTAILKREYSNNGGRTELSFTEDRETQSTPNVSEETWEKYRKELHSRGFVRVVSLSITGGDCEFYLSNPPSGGFVKW